MPPEYAIERSFPTSPENMFLAHSDPHLLVSWLAAPNAKAVVLDAEVRTGGYLRYAFESADRATVWGRFDYMDIQRPNAISLLQSLTDRDGLTISPFSQSHWLFRLKTDMNFHFIDNTTQMHMAISLYDASADEQRFFAFFWPRLAAEYESGLDRLSQAVKAERYN